MLLYFTGGGKSPALQSYPRITIRMADNAKLFFKGTAIISEGTSLRADKNAKIVIGKNFYCNADNYLRAGSGDTISFGNDCLLGWSNIINTTDGHNIWVKNIKSPQNGNININNHVWITTRCIIGKKVSIANDCVVASNSVVTKSINESNCLIAGLPAKCIKTGIDWKI